jgi:hypothetical protein
VSAQPKKTDEDTQFAEEIASYAYDPHGWVLAAFPWGEAGTELADEHGPRDWQRDTLIEIGRRLKETRRANVWDVVQKAVASGHGVGKSALVCWIILWAMSTFDDTRGIVTANTDTQLKTKTWAEMAKWHRMCIVRDWFELTATALYSRMKGHDRTWRFDCIPWSKTNTEAFAGLHNKGSRIVLIMDEGSGIEDKVWEVAEGALTDEDTEIIWIVFGNPTRNDGRFQRGIVGNLRHRWSPLQLDSRTVEGTNKAQIDKWIADYGEDSDFVRVRVKGQFPRAGALQYIGTDLVEIAMAREIEDEEAYLHAALVLGVDVARHGEDQTVITKRQGIKVWPQQKFRIRDTQKVADLIYDEIKEQKPDAVFIDATGIGWGVIDALKRKLGMGEDLIYAVQTAETAEKEQEFYNQRAELYGRGRAWIKECGVLPHDEELKTDLTAPEYGFDNKNRLQIEKKEDTKKRGMASPDCGDSLLLTFAAAVEPRRRHRGEEDPRRARDNRTTPRWMSA